MPYFYLLPGDSTIARNVWTIDGYDRDLDIQQNFIGDFRIGGVRNRLVTGLDFYNYNTNVIYHEFMGTAGGQTAADLFDVVNSSGNIPITSTSTRLKWTPRMRTVLRILIPTPLSTRIMFPALMHRMW
jgi:hypothetical protein